jgi:hypothetical protein
MCAQIIGCRSVNILVVVSCRVMRIDRVRFKPRNGWELCIGVMGYARDM